MSEHKSLSTLAPSKSCQAGGDYDKSVNWGSALLWFIIIGVIVWFVLFAVNPSWLRQNGPCGKKTDCIDYSKLFLATVVVAIVIMVLIWLFRRANW